MRPLRRISTLLLGMALVGLPASAQTTPFGANGGARVERMMAQVQSRFAAANTTHDGKLTRDQARSGMPMVAQHFDEIDTQQAGFVTLAQIEDFMRARAAAR